MQKQHKEGVGLVVLRVQISMWHVKGHVMQKFKKEKHSVIEYITD